MLEQDLQLIFSSAVDQLKGYPDQIHKMFKVTGHVQDLALNEKFEDVERDMVLAAAMLHNVGLGEWQRRQDRGEAADEMAVTEEVIRELLEPSDLNTFEIEGVLILVRTHKQVGFLENAMHQVLSEALLLAGLDDADDPAAKAKEVAEIFKTASGKTRLQEAYPQAFEG